jgi:hypothetical protein
MPLLFFLPFILWAGLFGVVHDTASGSAKVRDQS